MKKMVILLIRLYQRYISIFFIPRCRFYPSCSNYAICAIKKKGFVLGLVLSFWRIFRCNPYFPGGYDPVD